MFTYKHNLNFAFYEISLLSPSRKNGERGWGELSFNETQSRVALFNFRQLCHPLTNNTKLRHTNRKETKVFPKSALNAFKYCSLGKEESDLTWLLMNSLGMEFWTPTAKDRPPHLSRLSEGSDRIDSE